MKFYSVKGREKIIQKSEFASFEETKIYWILTLEKVDITKSYRI